MEAYWAQTQEAQEVGGVQGPQSLFKVTVNQLTTQKQKN